MPRKSSDTLDEMFLNSMNSNSCASLVLPASGAGLYMISVMRRNCWTRLGLPAWVLLATSDPVSFQTSTVSPRAESCPLNGPTTNIPCPPRGPLVRARNAFRSDAT